jgi:hypothetical protein
MASDLPGSTWGGPGFQREHITPAAAKCCAGWAVRILGHAFVGQTIPRILTPFPNSSRRGATIAHHRRMRHFMRRFATPNHVPGRGPWVSYVSSVLGSARRWRAGRGGSPRPIFAVMIWPLRAHPFLPSWLPFGSVGGPPAWARGRRALPESNCGASYSSQRVAGSGHRATWSAGTVL